MSIVSTVSVSGYQGINIAGIQPIYGVMLAYDEVSDALSRGPLSGNERKIAFSVSISDAQDPMSPINGNLIRDLVKGGPASSGDASLAINNYKYMVKYANEAGDDFQVNNGVVHVRKLLSIMRDKDEEVGCLAVASHNLIGDDGIPLHVEHFPSYSTQETTNIAVLLHMFCSCLYTRGFGYMKMQLKGFKPA